MFSKATPEEPNIIQSHGRACLKCDGTRTETRFGLSAKRMSPFKSAVGSSVQSTTGSWGVQISRQWLYYL